MSRCDLRFFDRFDIRMCMGGKRGVDRSLFWVIVVACAMLVAMSGCLEFSVSCSGVGPGGSFCRKMFSRFCHLGEMGVDWGSCLVSVFVRERRCSGEFALSCVRRYSSARCSVAGRCPRKCGLAHRIFVSDSMQGCVLGDNLAICAHVCILCSHKHGRSDSAGIIGLSVAN